MRQTEKADLSGDYQSAGFGGSLAFDRHPALLIVDFVRAYIEPGSPLYAEVVSEATILAQLKNLGRT